MTIPNRQSFISRASPLPHSSPHLSPFPIQARIKQTEDVEETHDELIILSGLDGSVFGETATAIVVNPTERERSDSGERGRRRRQWTYMISTALSN